MKRICILCVLLGLAVADKPTGGFNGGGGFGYGAPPVNGFNGGLGSSNGYGETESEIDELAENIPGGGVPGEDFPILSEVPETDFACEDFGVYGYYADTAPEAGCQVFHICQVRANGAMHKDSFLCPNGTIFNQQYLVCDWWYNFDCETAQDFYSVNELIGQDPNSQYGASQQQNSYAAPQGDQDSSYNNIGNPSVENGSNKDSYSSVGDAGNGRNGKRRNNERRDNGARTYG